VFRADLETALARSDRARGGRPPYDAVLMFKILVLQVLYGLSDDQTEFQILDRRSFGRFLGLDDGDRVPDAKTIWLFRETLTCAGAVGRLFERLDSVLNDRGYLAMGGQIIDATVVEARQPRADPCPRRTRLRRPETPARPDHPIRRPRPRQNQDHPRQPRLQHTTARLARRACRPRLSLNPQQATLIGSGDNKPSRPSPSTSARQPPTPALRRTKPGPNSRYSRVPSGVQVEKLGNLENF
jgi:transposase